MTGQSRPSFSSAWRNRIFWVLQGIGWLALLPFAVGVTGLTNLGWNDAVVLSLLRTAFGIGITCVLRILYQNVRNKQVPLRDVWLFVAVVCLLGSAVDALLALLSANLTGMDAAGEIFWIYLYFSILLRWCIYMIWSLLYFVINYWLDRHSLERKMARLESNARDIELKALREQISPHFLFNALGSILTVSDNPRSVRELTLALSEYLRLSLHQREDRETLDTELRALEGYLHVQKVRFEENLQCVVDVDAMARRALTPFALIQPLLENAIKYGQRTSVPVLTVRINARVSGGCLVVRVINSGTWIPPGGKGSTGSGLANLRRRLNLIYGHRGHLGIECTDGEVRVTVMLPAEIEEKRDAGWTGETR